MRTAVLIPCCNEEYTIGKVVRDFAAALPDATIYVYDNNSTDGTRRAAETAGAIVRQENRQGKGNVVCRMFADIDADVYVLVDGDDTYSASSAPRMIERLLSDQLDMVNGARVTTSRWAYSAGRHLGNRVLTALVARIFGNRFSDMLSGYRVLSRRFVKSFPALATGFEIETAFTVHALELQMPVAEIAVPYKERPRGSASKLHPLRDGFRILRLIIQLLAKQRPLRLFGALSLLFALASAVLAFPLFAAFFRTEQALRLPAAMLSMSLMLLALLSLALGFFINVVTLQRREMQRLRYLELSPPPALESPARDQQVKRTAPSNIRTFRPRS